MAVDIPSGIHSGSGQIMGIAFPADITVTFGWEKLGTMLYPGKEYSGTVIVAEIGFSRKQKLCIKQNILPLNREIQKWSLCVRLIPTKEVLAKS